MKLLAKMVPPPVGWLVVPMLITLTVVTGVTMTAILALLVYLACGGLAAGMLYADEDRKPDTKDRESGGEYALYLLLAGILWPVVFPIRVHAHKAP